MTVDINLGKVQYDGNDVATVFSFNFRIFLQTSVRVIKTDAVNIETVLVKDTDYTVTGIGSVAGGSITYPITGVPLPTGEKITIERYPEPLQQVNLLSQGGWHPQAVEDALDAMTHYLQRLDDEATRTLRLPVSYSGSADPELPIPEANKVLSWNAAGDALELIDPGSVALALAASESIVAAMVDVDDIIAIANKLLVVKRSGDTMTGNLVDAMLRFSRGAKVTTYNVLTTDTVIECDATGGAFPVNLITAVNNGGKLLMVKKTDASANAVTVDGDGTETIDTELTRVLTNQGDFVVIVSDNANWQVVGQSVQPHTHADATTGGVLPDVAVRDGHRGLVIFRATVATIDVDADEIVLNNGSGGVYLATAVNETLNITSSESGGLDTGSEQASTWYYIWVIYNGTVVNIMLSESPTAPTMPSGYTYKALVGATYNDSGSDLLGMTQHGNICRCVAGSIGSLTATTATALDITTLIPATARVFRGSLANTNADVRNKIHPKSYTAANNGNAWVTLAAGLANIDASFSCPIETAQEVYYSVSAGTGTIYGQGWEF